MPDTQISDSMVDAALEAFNAADSVPFAIPFDCMRAALTAALAGHVVVPREPTEAMIYAGRDRIVTAQIKSGWPGVHEIYRAMIQAAPPVQEMEG